MKEDIGLSFDQLDLLRRERMALAKLTDKQKLFCEEWVRSFDRIQAMKAGGYWTPKQVGTSQKKLADRNFEDIMASPTVQEYIFLLRQSVVSRLGLSVDVLIDEYKAMALSNMDDYVSWDNNGFTRIKASTELTRAQKAGILEISETTTKQGKVVKIKLYNKQPALDRLLEVLRELEEQETKPQAATKISQTQINLILQDPIKRRAIEHLAESLYGRQISLVGTDKARVDFEGHMAKITNKLMEATSGVSGRRNPKLIGETG